MNLSRIPRLLVELFTAVSFGFIVAFAWKYGWQGPLAYLLGIFAGVLFLAGSWLAIKVFSSFVSQQATGTLSMSSLFIALGFKLPLLAMFLFFFRGAWEEFQTCFLWGVGLVYFSLFGWGMTSTHDENTKDQNESK